MPVLAIAYQQSGKTCEGVQKLLRWREFKKDMKAIEGSSE